MKDGPVRFCAALFAACFRFRSVLSLREFCHFLFLLFFFVRLYDSAPQRFHVHLVMSGGIGQQVLFRFRGVCGKSQQHGFKDERGERTAIRSLVE